MKTTITKLSKKLTLFFCTSGALWISVMIALTSCEKPSPSSPRRIDDNEVPVVTQYQYSVNTGKSVSIYLSNTEDSELSFDILSYPKHGALSPGTQSNQRMYTPDIPFQGTDTLKYRYSGSDVISKNITIVIDVHVKRLYEEVEAGDVFKIAEQYLKWENDLDDDGEPDKEEVGIYSFLNDKFDPISNEENTNILQWGIKNASLHNDVIVYKKVGDREIPMLVYYPEGWNPSDERPVGVFFFGGGFNTGNYYDNAHRGRYFNSLGNVYICCDYRVKMRDNKDTDQNIDAYDRAFSDCKDAIRWIRSHSSELGIDPDKLIVHGSSAGTMIQNLHFTKDAGLDPNACVLQVPYGAGPSLDQIRNNIDNMTVTMPPTIIFSGGKDPISYPYGVNYAKAINDGGGYAVVHVYEDQPHIFSGVYPDMHERIGVFLTDIGLTGLK